MIFPEIDEEKRAWLMWQTDMLQVLLWRTRIVWSCWCEVPWNDDDDDDTAADADDDDEDDDDDKTHIYQHLDQHCDDDVEVLCAHQKLH